MKNYFLGVGFTTMVFTNYLPLALIFSNNGHFRHSSPFVEKVLILSYPTPFRASQYLIFSLSKSTIKAHRGIWSDCSKIPRNFSLTGKSSEIEVTPLLDEFLPKCLFFVLEEVTIVPLEQQIQEISCFCVVFEILLLMISYDFSNFRITNPE